MSGDAAGGRGGVLSAGVRPNDNRGTGLPAEDPQECGGFFIEAMLSCGRWTSLRRASFLRPGPQPQAHQRVHRPGPGRGLPAGAFLADTRQTISGVTAHVEPDRCAAACVRPHLSLRRAPDQPENVSEINEALCQGCGTCASECPAKVIQVAHF